MQVDGLNDEVPELILHRPLFVVSEQLLSDVRVDRPTQCVQMLPREHFQMPTIFLLSILFLRLCNYFCM